MMRATDRGRRLLGLGLGLSALALMADQPARAQGLFSKGKAKEAAPAAAKEGDEKVIKIVPKSEPASPNDAIAIINGEPITRQQLADEAVARKGKEILEMMIAGKIIDQAVNAKKMVISSQEIEEEIDSICRGMGVSKQDWLRTLDKERGVSPLQYKRDIIYRVIALRKLAAPLVVVTDEDMKKAFEANYGEKLHYRIIMTRDLPTAKVIWNELKQNPTAFEKIARDDARSIDTETKPLGGLAVVPMSRYAYPLNLSDAAFEQLVDGDLSDKDPAHKPKDGDMTGPIQVETNSKNSHYVILRRESVDPAQPYDPNDPEKKKQYKELLEEVKLKDKMQEVYSKLFEEAAVENRLTGEVRMAREKDHPGYRTDGEVKLMNGSTGTSVPKPQGAATVGGLGLPKPKDAPPKPDMTKQVAPKN